MTYNVFSGTLNLTQLLNNYAKPYSCRHCSECFTQPEQLKTHLLKSHNEDTWLAYIIHEWKCVTLVICKMFLH